MTLRRAIDTPRIDTAESEPSHERFVLRQEEFHRVIALERRRTERSRKPFLLMLLDMGDHLPTEAVGKNLNRLLSTLSSSTRETDVAGWYATSSVIGVMFTEIAFDDQNSIVATMISRLSEILRKHLSLEQFNRVNISFHVFPEEWDQENRKRPSNPMLYPDLTKQAAAKRGLSLLKRSMDIVGSLFAIILLAPLFLIVALALKATSSGPIFFRQKRVGQHGEPFVFLKFRSMYLNNDASAHKEYVTQLIAGKAKRQASAGCDGVFKLTGDPRVTPVGAFLRKTSLDELPQFINVLMGDMSLVGPRPPLPYEVEAYDFWHRRRLLEAKPGITGLWQVSGRSRVTFDEMVRLDLRYAKTWSPWMDIKIIARTPAAVVFGAH